jgi:hypothetical protein
VVRRARWKALPLRIGFEYGLEFETLKPVCFLAVRNTENALYFGSRFQQDIEPAGLYMLHNSDPGDLAPGWVSFRQCFVAPLVLALTMSSDGPIYGPHSWKASLHRVYHKTGKALRNTLVRDGFDGIITIDRDGFSREIVAL